VLVVLAVLACTGILALGWEASSRAMSPKRAVFPWTLADYPELQAQDVSVRSTDGVDLEGRFFQGRSRATVIVSHGYGGAQDEVLPIVRTLARAGLSVFTYDLRGCGATGGRVTFGAYEQRDLVSIVDYLASRADVDAERIGALGFSMAAAATIMAAAGDPRIKVVVDDSGWCDVYHWLRPSFRTWAGNPRHQFSPLSLKLVEFRTGIKLRALRPVDVVGRLQPRPLLVIHGADDDVVPPGDSKENYRAAGEPKELWIVPNAVHGDTVAPGGPTSSDRVGDFLARALSS
jgi:uncharacterized protein